MKRKTREGKPRIYEVYPYLCVRGGVAAIEFYKRAFGASEGLRLEGPGGRIAHAEIKLGSTTVMLADEFPQYGIRSPLAYGGTGTTIHLHVDNVDAVAKQAVEAGATIIREPADQEHGERQCRLRDPFGHEWLLGHEIEKVTPKEIKRRFRAQFKK